MRLDFAQWLESHVLPQAQDWRPSDNPGDLVVWINRLVDAVNDFCHSTEDGSLSPLTLQNVKNAIGILSSQSAHLAQSGYKTGLRMEGGLIDVNTAVDKVWTTYQAGQDLSQSIYDLRARIDKFDQQYGKPWNYMDEPEDPDEWKPGW